MKRIDSLDILKGIIIVLMSLDHFRDYFHSEAFFFNPTDPENTNAITFFIRWVTHYCAPIFAFLAGVSAYIVGNKYNKKYLSKFLLTRGLWLVFVEIVINRLPISLPHTSNDKQLASLKSCLGVHPIRLSNTA